MSKHTLLWLTGMSRRCVYRRYRMALLVFLLLGSFPALLGQSRTVRGTVVDAATHAPIGRALVVSGDQQMAQLTDGEGRFSFDLQSIPPGSQSMIVLLARRPGYLNAQPKAFPLGGAAESDVELKLTPEARISGRITAPGAETTGVRIDLLHWQVQEGLGRWAAFQSRTTNSRGEYRFTDLEAGEYKLMTSEWVDPSTISAPGRNMIGYPPAHFPEAADPASASAMRVRAGESVQADITLHPQPYYPVHVPIANLARGAFLSVTVGNEALPSGFSLGFNPNTRVIEGDLPDGIYHVFAASFGEQQATGSIELTVAGGPAHSSPLTLIPNISLPVIVREQFTATHQQELPQFRGGFSSPLQGEGQSPPVAINLQAEEGGGAVIALRAAKPGESNPVLENVRPGRFRVIATPFRGYVASLSAGGIDLLHQPLVIVPGGGSAPIELTLRDDTAELAVTVTGARPPANPYLPSHLVVGIPLDSDTTHLLQAVAGQQGTLTMPDVPPGRYLLLAFPPDQLDRVQNLEYRNDAVMESYKSRGTVVTLAPGQHAQVEVPPLPEDAE